jgi:ribokinase
MRHRLGHRPLTRPWDAADRLDGSGEQRGNVMGHYPSVVNPPAAPSTPSTSSTLTAMSVDIGGRVVVVGSANADLVVSVRRRPGAGETVLGGELVTLPGGKGANQAVAAARLGAATSFVGRVGDDAHGRLLLESLRGAGVDVTGVGVGSEPTGVAIVYVTPDGDNSIVVAPGANGALTADHVRTAAVSGAQVLLLQREIDPATSLAAADCCRGLVLLNLAPSGPMPLQLLHRTDVLVVNEHEAADLLGTRAAAPSPDGAGAAATDVAIRLRELGPAAVVITLGPDGAVAADAAGSYRVRSPRVPVVDTTGAGDAFTGALAWRLAVGDDLPGALEVAVRVGALAVTRAGAQPSFPSAAQLEHIA